MHLLWRWCLPKCQGQVYNSGCLSHWQETNHWATFSRGNDNDAALQHLLLLWKIRALEEIVSGFGELDVEKHFQVVAAQVRSCPSCDRRAQGSHSFSQWCPWVWRIPKLSPLPCHLCHHCSSRPSVWMRMCMWAVLPPTAVPPLPGTLAEQVCYFIIHFAQRSFISTSPQVRKKTLVTVFMSDRAAGREMWVFLVMLIQQTWWKEEDAWDTWNYICLSFSSVPMG